MVVRHHVVSAGGFGRAIKVRLRYDRTIVGVLKVQHLNAFEVLLYFWNEALLLGAVRHPNIVKLLRIFRIPEMSREPGRPFCMGLLLEFGEGPCVRPA